MSDNIYMVLRDRLGSADVVLNAQGQRLTDYNYAPYGRMMHANSSGMDLEYSKYTDKPDDAALGMQFFGARYYDPRLRRFISPDPVVPGAGKNPQGFNQYSYNLNNPFRWVDPDGREPDDPAGPQQHSSWYERAAAGAAGIYERVSVELTNKTDSLVQRASTWMAEQAVEIQARMRGQLERAAEASQTPDMVVRPGETVTYNEFKAGGEVFTEGAIEVGKQGVLSVVLAKGLNGIGTGGKLVRDFATKETKLYTAVFKSQGEARSLARTKLGRDALMVEPGKLRSADGRWQFRGKPEDLKGHGPADTPHIHLERLNPETGEVLENWHFRWQL